MDKTYKINIFGRVQGVGFRPFIFNLATKFELFGYVSNDENGVIIVVQGNDSIISNFYAAIEIQKPKSAFIHFSEITEIQTSIKYSSFEIVPTAKNVKIDAPLTPDFAICKSCQSEIMEPTNRRYFYPFTTCTQCGPRYSITEKFPFERENTSVSRFKMCPTCEAEYKNPNDIRFHSQTNSCSNCGIKITFTDNLGTPINGSNYENITRLCQELVLGKIIAVKNTSGYLLLCDATNAETIQELRLRKKRKQKPFAVLFPTIETILNYLEINNTQKEQLTVSEAPIVILKQKNNLVLAINAIAPNRKTIGAMLPNSGILTLIATVFNKPIVATSGNFHGSPICATVEEAVAILKPIADYFLHHNLDIQHAQDDSVVKFSEKYQHKIILRRARGFAPNIDFKATLQLLNPSKNKILCLGGDLKNTIAIVPNNQCYISEYIGDLSNYDTYKRFEKTFQSYQTIFDFVPNTILMDQHPNYESAKIVSNFNSIENLEIVKIQHHEAHFSAVLGEHHLWDSNQKTLGIIWDGTGYGTASEIWGGEFFELQNKVITRIGHLDYFAWILGDKMAKNPKISALSICENKSEFYCFFNQNEQKIYSKLIAESQIKTSSMGRFFDAIAFVLGFENPISFEGEAALYLEDLAQKAHSKNENTIDYLQNVTFTNCIPTQKLFQFVLEASRNNVAIEKVALNFHFTLVKCIEKIAIHNNSRNLAFSGGVFQNSVLIDLILEQLDGKFNLYFHKNKSSNDENISFGQLSYYLNTKQN